MDSTHIRRDYLKALGIMYSQAKKELVASSKRGQVFMAIFPDDSGSDAVYVHTENPQSPFPYEVPGTIELDYVPWLLQGVARLDQHQIMLCEGPDSHYFMVSPR